MTVADRVRMRREELGLSQEQLAHKLGLKSRSSVTRIEKSGDDITLRDVERLSTVLDCSPLYLMGWDNKEENEQQLREKHFIEMYSRLASYQKSVVDKLLESLIDEK